MVSIKIETAVAVGLLAIMEPTATAQAVDYLRDVKPILAERCTSCHGAIRQKGGLRVDTAAAIRRGGTGGPAIVPGQSDASILIDRITAGETSSDRMPPPSEGVALGAHEVGILRDWIDRGAVAPPEPAVPDPRRHWAYVPPARTSVPHPANRPALKNPIDAFLEAVYQSRGLHPSPPVTDDLLLRRVNLDLVGLPPTRDERRAFLADPAPDAYEKVVDRLLASPQYGERWGRHWMDVWRYSDWYGLGAEARYSHPHLWHWRDWIIAALNADKGYDRMIVEMVAADELTPDDPATVAATGFLVRNWDIFNRNAWLGNTVEHTARAFLGVTIGCARCHDHKFDPIAQTEYYRLRAFFEPVHIRIDRVPGQPDRVKKGLPRAFDDFLTTPTVLFVRGDETRPDPRPLTPATPAVLGGEIKISPVPLPITVSSPDKREFVIRETTEIAEQAIRDARTALAQARSKLVRKTMELAGAATVPETIRRELDDARNDLAVGESALVLAELRQNALLAVLSVEQLENQGTPKDASGPWARAAQQASVTQKTLAVHEAGHKCLVAQRTLDHARQSPEKMTAEVTDASKRLVEGKKERIDAERLTKEPTTTAYTPRPLAFHRAKTSFNEVPVNKPYPTTSSGRRLALARWIVDRQNPLTARVAVNHIWMRHFGEPLVSSTFDFGLRTPRPLYHELLDWLAVELVESGWSMKHLHRLIVTSEAYRRQSEGVHRQAENIRIDPDNHAFWRMNVRRMEAEVIRDSLLQLAGRLDSRIGGEDLPLASAETVSRRSIYFRYARGDRIPFLTVFDAPNVEECYRRDETIVPQQALALSNSSFALGQAAVIAASIDREVGATDKPAIRSAFVTSAFERLLGRTPTSAERSECIQALDHLRVVFDAESQTGQFPFQKARAALVHVLINHNDFVSIR
jgi:hypothetical protein